MQKKQALCICIQIVMATTLILFMSTCGSIEVKFVDSGTSSAPTIAKETPPESPETVKTPKTPPQEEKTSSEQKPTEKTPAGCFI